MSGGVLRDSALRSQPIPLPKQIEGGLMSSLASLWLPTLVSAVLVFVVSSIIHMVLPWHKSDRRG